MNTTLILSLLSTISPSLVGTTPQDDDQAEVNAPVGILNSPGMPRIHWGQSSRFTSAFNPAIGLAIDTALSWADNGEEDGLALDLNVAEITAQAAISPNWWGMFALETDAEEVELSEGALFYTGLAERSSLKAGKFFIDFGKQMQVHIHDLSTPQRPAVLREYLGEESAGVGVQFDHWSPVGETTAMRFSLGLFGEVESHGHGFLFEESEEEEEGEVEAAFADRRDLGELIMTARATAMTDVGENSVLQFGASMRSMPDFTFEGGSLDTGDGLAADGLDQSVYGLDLTYGWTSDDGTRSWTTGAEFVRAEGDIGAEVVDDGLPSANLEVYDGSAQGWFAYVDHAWNRQNSAGIMLSAFEHLEEERPEDLETTLYWSHYPTEFSRVRFAFIHMDREEEEDAHAFMIQLTGYVGAHGHPYNW